MVILKPEEVYMVRVEDGETVIYGLDERYYSRKRLYEISEQLGRQFMQISKGTLIIPGNAGQLILDCRMQNTMVKKSASSTEEALFDHMISYCMNPISELRSELPSLAEASDPPNRL